MKHMYAHEYIDTQIGYHLLKGCGLPLWILYKKVGGYLVITHSTECSLCTL